MCLHQCLADHVCLSSSVSPGSWSPGFTPPPKMNVLDDSDSWCVVTRYTHTYDYPSIPGIKDPRLLKKRLIGYRKVTVRKKLMLGDDKFDFKKIKHIDRLERRDVGFSGRDWSDFY